MQQGDLNASHGSVLDGLTQYIEKTEVGIVRFDTRVLVEPESKRNALALLRKISGIDLIGAAVLLVPIGSDVNVVGDPDRLASGVGFIPGNNESDRKP